MEREGVRPGVTGNATINYGDYDEGCTRNRIKPNKINKE